MISVCLATFLAGVREGDGAARVFDQSVEAGWFIRGDLVRVDADAKDEWRQLAA
jgi:hypothetical protein